MLASGPQNVDLPLTKMWVYLLILCWLLADMIGSVIWDCVFYRFAIYKINEIRWPDAFAVALATWRRCENLVTEKSFISSSLMWNYLYVMSAMYCWVFYGLNFIMFMDFKNRCSLPSVCYMVRYLTNRTRERNIQLNCLTNLSPIVVYSFVL